MSKIKKVSQLAKQGFEFTRDRYNTQKELEATLRQKESADLLEAMKKNEMNAVINARGSVNEYERIVEVQERYREIMSPMIGRVALVTNFARRPSFIDPAKRGFEVGQKLLEATEIGSSDFIIVEAIADNSNRERIDEFTESADALCEALGSQTSLFVRSESHIASGLRPFPVDIADRIEGYTDWSTQGAKFGYVAVTSALKLDSFGLGVEHAPFLGAHGDAYESLKDGGIAVPSEPRNEARWNQIG